MRLAKLLPKRAPPVRQAELQRIAEALAAEAPADLMEEIRRQNQDMVIQLEELNARQQELSRLNQELQDTNRGVVALYAELDERADHLRRADELKSRFLSNMSHEFRTPLNSILALSRLLLGRTDGELTAEQEKQVQFIRKAAESLTELVNDLLDLAKVEAGKIVVTPIECSAEGLFATLRGMLRPLLVGDAVGLVFEDPANIPPLLQDEAKLSQILRNLISNAIKFTERGEVRIWAAYDRDGDTVSFSVRDTGIGIAEEDLEIIFQEFGQVANPMQRRIKGTGLGLPLSKKLSELLGGSITVESAPGEGSVFSVTVPRICRDASGLVDGTEDWHVQDGRLPVLAVEDDPADAFAIERILAPSRYQAVVARSVAAARHALEQVRPAAVILDVVLLGDESWRLLIELRQRDATADIPVLVVSSAGEERKAINLGADEYLGKPIDPERLIGLLDQLTGQSSVTRVLLIDDEEVSRYLVRQLLPRGTYDLREAATGVEGLARLEDERPDIVLLDLNLPGMNGYQFLERLGNETEHSGDRSDLDDPRQRAARSARQRFSNHFQIRPFGAGIDRGDHRCSGWRRGAQAMSTAAMKVLVVDDDDAGRYVKAHILAGRGYAVTEAGSGHIAIEQVAADPPDLVLLDVRLPDIGGVEVCRHIKAAFPQIAVLQTSSALSSAQERAAALDGGADSYLIEPIEPDELVAVVKALLRMRKAEQELRQLNETLEARVAERARALAEADRRFEAEQANRRQAEDVLWHTQKLEAVGQLTGGVAHDFNNLLTVITGNLDLLQEVVAGNRAMARERQLKLVAAAQNAAEHGAQMIRQLLAFSRRSVLHSETVDLKAVIAGFEDFLRRALGEAITLDLAFAPDLWPCDIDPAQFEAAILNLVVNARDAMPGGGHLRIASGNLDAEPAGDSAERGPTPGAYVWVSVSDDGVGMEPDVVERAFEPFFTTKEVGQGSGLGLSQVYGFVAQSNGHVAVESVPGAGTCLTLYLPRAEGAVPGRTAPAQSVGAPSGLAGETVLVVEDNAEVLGLAVAMIRDLGYRVVVAADGVEALALLRDGAAVDLLFTDIVMPRGFSGVALAAEARRIRGEIKIVLTSGYPAMRDPAPGSSAGSGDFPIIPKPYSRDALARTLRKALDSRTAPQQPQNWPRAAAR